MPFDVAHFAMLIVPRRSRKAIMSDTPPSSLDAALLFSHPVTMRFFVSGLLSVNDVMDKA